MDLGFDVVVTITGIVLVFLILVLLMAIITLEGKIFDSEEFYCNQYCIMKNVKTENAEELCNKLDIEISEQKHKMYIRYEVTKELSISAEQVVIWLSETCVFKKIFERMRKGQQQEIDWFVLLGTIGRLDADGKILLAILEKYPCYDETTTRENIRKHRGDYYPATFGYLYQMYNLKMENILNPEETGYEYLLRRAGLEKPKRIEMEKVHFGDKKDKLYNLKIIAKKEENYAIDNDEVISVEIMNSLVRVSEYELSKYNDIIRKISTKEISHEQIKPEGYKTNQVI